MWITFLDRGYSNIDHITIPESVTTIGQEAFYWLWLPSIALPESVIYIGEDAFEPNDFHELVIPGSVKVTYGFLNSDQIVLMDGIEQICDKSFYLSDILSIEIPSSVNVVASGVFSGTSLTKIVVRGKKSLTEFEVASGLEEYEDIIEFRD